ncbi:MAG: hypothetical protein N2259_01080 [Patescibacteria group bacterium]|nr:hypothetical protein [Patescibacteria group bacterium]
MRESEYNIDNVPKSESKTTPDQWEKYNVLERLEVVLRNEFLDGIKKSIDIKDLFFAAGEICKSIIEKGLPNLKKLTPGTRERVEKLLSMKGE